MILDALLGLTRAGNDGAVTYRGIENPAVPLTSANIAADLFGAQPTTTGIYVDAGKALEVAAVFQCVSLLAGDVASLPLDIYRRDGDTKRKLDKSHPAWFLVAREPNPLKTPFVVWSHLVATAALYGNSFIWIRREGSRPVALWNLDPQLTTFRDVAPEGEPPELVVTSNINGKLRTFDYEDVLHLERWGLDGICGTNLLTSARNTIATRLSQEGFTADYYKNGLVASGIFVPALPMDAAQAAAFRDSMAKIHAGQGNRHKAMVIPRPGDYKQTSASLEDSQMVEAAEEMCRDVARFFNIPPSLLGLKGSVSYNSREADERQYLTHCLNHWLTPIAEQVRRKLFGISERVQDTHIAEHNVEMRLKGDYATRMDGYQKLLAAGGITPNQIAAKENEEPGGPDGDQRFVTANVVPLDKVGEIATAKANPAPAPAKTGKPTRMAAMHVLQDALKRLNRRVIQHAERYEKRVGTLDAGFQDELKNSEWREAANDIMGPALKLTLAVGVPVDPYTDPVGDTLRWFGHGIEQAQQDGKTAEWRKYVNGVQLTSFAGFVQDYGLDQDWGRNHDQDQNAA